ncbi:MULTISPECIES: GNAT family N-acetyltransferase [unclassified Corynebacterium]|uniref:GNAT family N-acetyltransferase n=1 Tax=unclassified Corynebacterium TaxID=2624378 RepID=UPI0035237562
MNTTRPGFIHDVDSQRYVITIDGVEAGYVSYELLTSRLGEPALRDFNHTVIHSDYRGSGLSSRLIRFALDDTIEANLAYRSTCSAVEHFISKHPAYVDGLDGSV